MRIQLLTLGDPPPDFFAAAADFYLQRLPKAWRVTSVRIPSASGKRSNQALLEAETAQIERRLKPGSMRVALVIEARQMDSVAFAARLQNWLVDGRDIDFIIGSANGLAAEFVARCDVRWSLSQLTFPHHLAQVLLAEQLYRASTIHTGHPYHSGH